ADTRDRVRGEPEGDDSHRPDQRGFAQCSHVTVEGHFSSMRGASGNSFGFSPVAGMYSASKRPRLRTALIRLSGSGCLPIRFSSNTELFHFKAGTAFRMPRSA